MESIKLGQRGARRDGVTREAEEEEMAKGPVEDGAAENKMIDGEPSVQEDPRLHDIFYSIRVVPHFPKPGIMFNDVTTLLLRPQVFKDTVDILAERYRDMGISVVAGIEARGLIFGSSVALALGAKFVPLRKPNKLPGEVISERYTLEYGHDRLEMHVDAVQAGERTLIIDDFIATGGTISAAINLLDRVGANVIECACVVGLPKYKENYTLNGKPIYILVECRNL